MLTTITASDRSPAGQFVDYLHTIREDERVALARKMHDEIGGLLVAASMDLAWAETHLSDPQVLLRLRRLGRSLAGAIDIKRLLIEQLRPTLLDNLGLFAALRWYFKEMWHHASAICSDSYPDRELALPSTSLSHIFRTVQTLLDCTFEEEQLKAVTLDADVADDVLIIRVAHEHEGPEPTDVLEQYRHQLLSAAHRVAAIRGELSFEALPRGVVYYLTVLVNNST